MSEFADRLLGPELAVTLEITPPKKRLDDVLLRRARLLGSQANAINVIQQPDRLSSLDAALILRQAGLDAVCHVVNRERDAGEIASELRSAGAIHALVPKVRVVPMLMSPGSLAAARRLRERLGFDLPSEFLSRLESAAKVEGWRIFREINASLAASSRSAGVAVMTPELDAAPAAAQRVAGALAAVRG